MPEAVAVAPPWSRPLLAPTRVLALPSPGHQPARPGGAERQVAAGVRKLVTRRTAAVSSSSVAFGRQSAVAAAGAWRSDRWQGRRLPEDIVRFGTELTDAAFIGN